MCISVSYHLSLSVSPSSLLPLQDGLFQQPPGANNFHSRVNPADRRGSSPARQGSEVVVNKTPLSKAVSTSGIENRTKLAVAETRPHSAESKDSLKRDKLAEEVERIAVSLTLQCTKLCLNLIGKIISH